jgi:hypothetical protein
MFRPSLSHTPKQQQQHRQQNPMIAAKEDRLVENKYDVEVKLSDPQISEVSPLLSCEDSSMDYEGGCY